MKESPDVSVAVHRMGQQAAKLGWMIVRNDGDRIFPVIVIGE